MHERIGRVGSQRITLFNGLLDVFSPRGLLPGGGVCIHKYPLGVTVRQIEFIDDASISSPSCPIYAMLISREVETKQTELNDDGISPEERQQIKAEKEAAHIRKQVEADLGGFDIEQEWVEEIERDECFEVDKRLGHAPPMPTHKFEVWLVDASSGWAILDKYELDDLEYGTALKVLYLTDVSLLKLFSTYSLIFLTYHLILTRRSLKIVMKFHKNIFSLQWEQESLNMMVRISHLKGS